MNKNLCKKLVFCFALTVTFSTHSALAEEAYVSKGVLYNAAGKEVSLFGANYNLPFAYGYRSVKKLGLDHKKVIDMDVDHIARLGLSAYRIHLWDRLLSDQQGNLLDNEHLALFDYLMMRLSEENITSIITPLAWWGSGYPEKDPREPGFSTRFEKHEMNQNPDAIQAQKRYLTQLMNYKNRYTGQVYGTDPNILAFELFNEPKHKADAQSSAAYVESLIATMRAAGVTKPLFYNISEQGNDQAFAQALCQSSIDGIAYQWYPTGLLKYSELQTNVLPNVAKYHNPFKHIEACADKAKMIYEFDAADIDVPVMYPAMARSFRAEGFQWATQFAYDTAALSDSNAEYNTHYFNLLYTPAKAISLMIAGEVFKNLPRHVNVAQYPESNQFDLFTIDYSRALSLFNSAEKFIYTNTNEIEAKSAGKLVQVAGVGQSKLVNYQGSGAYFLDKIKDGMWRLEVFPDVIRLDDPYKNSSLKREVGRLYFAKRQIKINIPNLNKQFYFNGINLDNHLSGRAEQGAIVIEPGVYLLANKPVSQADMKAVDKDYYLPAIKDAELTVSHQAARQLSLADELVFEANIGAAQVPQDVSLNIRYLDYRKFTTVKMEHIHAGLYRAKLAKSEEWELSGMLEYAISVNINGQTTTFPGGAAGQPNEWDFVDKGYWYTELRAEKAPVELFNAALDVNSKVYPKDGHSGWQYVSAQNDKGLALRLTMDNVVEGDENWLVRLTPSSENPVKRRNLAGYNTLAIKARAVTQTEYIEISMLDANSLAYGTRVKVSPQWQYLLIPLSKLKPTQTLLTQAYPVFMPVSLSTSEVKMAEIIDMQNLNNYQGFQFRLVDGLYKPSALDKWHAIDIESIELIQR
ncbi:hypothetical protein [Catenovulum sediminis]|uniref:Glycoside hydrolase family 5 domain-containing protein n=1 Tax=Catenovulum sediminis TaxID=1740262 RepID=A0ABV1RGN0_9ALTE|nr:hypothetical protein [Catenovulum sediminis]